MQGTEGDVAHRVPYRENPGWRGTDRQHRDELGKEPGAALLSQQQTEPYL